MLGLIFGVSHNRGCPRIFPEGQPAEIIFHIFKKSKRSDSGHLVNSCLARVRRTGSIWLKKYSLPQSSNGKDCCRSGARIRERFDGFFVRRRKRRCFSGSKIHAFEMREGRFFGWDPEIAGISHRPSSHMPGRFFWWQCGSGQISILKTQLFAIFF